MLPADIRAIKRRKRKARTETRPGPGCYTRAKMDREHVTAVMKSAIVWALAIACLYVIFHSR